MDGSYPSMNNGNKYPINDAVSEMKTYKLAPNPVRPANMRCTYPIATPYKMDTKKE